MAGDEPGRLVPLLVVPQHPEETPPVEVHVPGPIRTGPIGSRLAVFDYHRGLDAVFPAAEVRPDGTFAQGDDPAGLHFQQLNAYAVTSRAIAFVEYELGRTLSWGFDASRLILLPHAGEMANAFYSKDTTSLQFFSYLLGDTVYHTCLVHDIVAHETGHALLDAVRGRFIEALHPETAALHEGFADLAAVLAALSHDVVRNAMLDSRGRFRSDAAVARIAEGFNGPDTSGRGALRDLASASDDPDAFTGVTEPHLLSLKLTRTVFATLRRFFEVNRAAGDPPERALRIAHRALQRMVVRGLDYLPPADATFEDFARALLQADAFANPGDDRGYRRVLAAEMAGHGIGAAAESLVRNPAGVRPWTRDDLPWPPRTHTEAYLFLDAHRRRLALHPHAEYRDFVVRRLEVTRAPAQRARRRGLEPGDVENVVIVYEYPVDVELRSPRFGSLQGAFVTMRGGGTLVFDGAGVLRHHARKPVTRPRVDAALEFLGSLLAGRLALVHGRSPRPVEGAGSGRPYLAEVDGGRILLTTNLAAGCVRRMPVSEGRP